MFFAYDVLNFHQDYLEDMEAKQQRMIEDKLTSKHIPTLEEMKKSRLAATDFDMHPKAKAALEFLDEEDIAIGLLLPEHPIEMDVERFVGKFGSRFRHIIPTEATKVLEKSGKAVLV